MLEKHVRNKTADFLNKENVFPDNQHGFRTGRSCTTMLLKTFEDWTQILDKSSGTHIHAVFLDWSKAFDKVPHERLLSKLEHYGIKGHLLDWYRNFLTGRTQRVVFGGAQSEPTDVSSGVIQGSVLGPFLFNVYVADLPSSIKKSKLKQFADDCSVSKEIKCENDRRELQEDLDSVDVWCENNGMELNALKCKVMDITHARSVKYPAAYEISGQKLVCVETERLLGVHISKDLKWNHHTEVTRKKAAQILGFAQRNLKGCTPRVKWTAYLTMVKPILFYGTPAWHPGKTNCAKIERVQKRALKFIHGSNPPLTTQKKVMPVEMQLRYTDLLFFKKCETGDTDCDVRERIVERRTLRGGGNSSAHPMLQPLPVRTVAAEKAFAFRVVGPWNNLPDRLKDCTVDKFPGLLKAHLWQNVNV